MARFAILLICAATTAFATRPPFVPEDLWQWRSIFEPRISSDGNWVAYVESWNDQAADGEFSNLWLVSADGRSRRQLTKGHWRDRSPRWSPDGSRLAWLSDRDGHSRIWTGKVDPAAEPQVIDNDLEPLSLAWSPDGRSIAFTTFVPSAAGNPVWATPAIVELMVRPREGHVALFVIPVAGGPPRRISSAELDLVGEAAWMPDGRSILVARASGEILSLRISDGAVKQLTDQGSHNRCPMPSSDGSRIAWIAAGRSRKLWVMNADGSRARILSGALDRDAAEPQWSSDSRTLYFLADDRGTTHVYAARNDGTVRQVTDKPERLSGFSLADNGRAVAVRATPSEAESLYTFTVDRVSQPNTLAGPDEHLLAEREISPAEEIAYPSAGNSIQAWIVKPREFDAARKYPLLVDIRDHPEMCGVDFNLRAQIFAARGFVVLCVNPRGTSGYGEVFANLLRTRDPGDDFDDVMRGVEFVASKPYIDGSRIAVAGGLLAAWAIGHTDRFKAAIVQHLSLDRIGAAWEDPEHYLKHSPLSFAREFRTPTLVLATGSDAASDALFSALQANHVRAALVRLGQPAKPSVRILEMQAISSWLSFTFDKIQ